eukprot:3778102-Pyramimonas_sp.AAC.1
MRLVRAVRGASDLSPMSVTCRQSIQMRLVRAVRGASDLSPASVRHLYEDLSYQRCANTQDSQEQAVRRGCEEGAEGSERGYN